MTSTYTSRRKFELSSVFERAVAALGSNGLGLLAATLVIVGIPQGLVSWIDGSSGMSPLGYGLGMVLATVAGWIVSIVCGTVMQGVVTDTVVADLQRRKPTLGDAFAAAGRSFWPLLGVGILSGLAIGLGLILLIVPGVLIFLVWFVAAPVVVAERAGPMTAFRRSVELIRNHRLWILGLAVIYLLASLFFGMLTGLLALTLAWFGPAMIIVTAAVSAISTLVWGAIAAATYVELRIVKEGGGRDAVASIFD